MWLYGKSNHTQRGYQRDVSEFLEYIELESLREVRLEDLQDFSNFLEEKGLADSTRARKLSAIKSLFSFANKIGYLYYNVGTPIQTPKVKNRLGEKILSEEEIFRMLANTKNQRNYVLIRLMYVSGARVSEICSLKWRDAQIHKDAGVLNIFGKGGKTRTVFLSPKTWEELIKLKKEANQDDPIFESQKGGHLDPSAAYRIVKKVAKKAGIDKEVSPHWLRHAHASHALDKGVAPHVVRDTLGHSSIATTNRYSHARPEDSSARSLSL
ncbi:hypothetical protein U472_00140 [Orenia metallireducens]|uniref:Integrase n=2 Tax=Orenia metallireducens TaxID=1413210 RepID=A0A1C0ADL5_9FIRM|nr:hypothetical protein U472_00140 [Orenia metallireducens]